MEIGNKRRGIVNALRLPIFMEPKDDAELVCKIRYLSQVYVDMENSTEEFYKVSVAMGAEGYVKKDQVILR